MQIKIHSFIHLCISVGLYLHNASSRVSGVVVAVRKSTRRRIRRIKFNIAVVPKRFQLSTPDLDNSNNNSWFTCFQFWCLQITGGRHRDC